MGRSSGRTGARTCPRCAALLLTDATSCGICRMDLTAPAPPLAPPAPEEPAADPIVEAPVFEAPVFEAPVTDHAPAADQVAADTSLIESAAAEPVVDVPVVEQAFIDEPPLPHAASSESAAAEVSVPDVVASPTPPTAPAHQHRAIDARSLQAPAGLSSSIAVLGVLQALSLGLSVLLAWWAVQQVQSALDAVFTFDAESAEAGVVDSANSLNGALATAGASALVGVVSLLLSLAVLVCLMVWTSRARQVAVAVSPGEHRFSSTWAVIGWIVPVAALVVPFLTLSDLYKSADPRTSQTRGRFTGSIPSLIAGWWGAWVVSWVLLVIQQVNGNGGTSALNIPTFSALQWLWLLATVASTVFMIMVVRRITGWQQAQIVGSVADSPPQHSAFDPRFGSEWNNTAPIPGLPQHAPTSGELTSAGPYASQQQATQAYLPPPGSPSLDQSRINPRDPFSFPPPGQVG